jgi:hypothetical protein
MVQVPHWNRFHDGFKVVTVKGCVVQVTSRIGTHPVTFAPLMFASLKPFWPAFRGFAVIAVPSAQHNTMPSLAVFVFVEIERTSKPGRLNLGLVSRGKVQEFRKGVAISVYTDGS